MPQQEPQEETSEKVVSKAASDKGVIPVSRRELPQPVVPEEIAEETADETATEAVSYDAVATDDKQGKDMDYRGAWIRLVSFVVDFVVLLIISLIVGRIIAFWATAPGEIGLVIGAIYFVGFWTWRGQTPGKMLTKARIVKANGSSIGLGAALLRYIFYVVPFFAPIPYFASRIPYVGFLIPVLGFIVVAFSRTKRGPHDLIAGTYVVSTRSRVFQDMTSIESESDEPSEKKEADAAKQG